MEKSLTSPIRYIKGVGPKKAGLFNKMGINAIEDILYYFPRRYEDRSQFIPISELKEGVLQTIKAVILAKSDRRSFRRRGFSIIEIIVQDETGEISCVWFNQPYLKDYFKIGETLILYGRIERFGKELQMGNPDFEIVPKEETAQPKREKFVPVYDLTKGITQRYLRKIIKYVFGEYIVYLNDFLPFDIRSRNNLLNLAKSIINIHFPDNLDIQKEAYKRLAFEEFFIFQIPLILRKLKRKEKVGIAYEVRGGLLEAFIANLPFQLTSDQQKVVREIELDMTSQKAMQRLLQGDVGSGKTVVAAIASIIAIQGGYQAAFMVPTEILAKQHFEKINSQIAGISLQGKKIKIGLLTGAADKKEKEKIYQEIKEGKINLILGTHALLEEKVRFKNLGLAVIDEQHKFGVGQRALLPEKGFNPDVLIMTATPIPRTLAITLYGDMDVSIIKELPPGRFPVKTYHFKEKERPNAYVFAKKELKKGRQVYIIYPLIEESYVLDIDGAEKMYEELKAGEFREFELGLIHGRLKQDEQDEIMSRFKNGELDILISTTVLEVGIDIANATCMIIEHAERFGLSQLHQLRGRIGRGKEESVCILVSDAAGEDALSRFTALVKYNDGFRIAEEDLKIRGPGEFFGLRQHGLCELKIANPLTQMQLLKRAREEAVKLIASDQRLEMRQNRLLREKLLQRFPEYEKLMAVG